LGDGKKIALDFSAAASYRISRNMKLSLDLSFKTHDLYTDGRQYQFLNNIAGFNPLFIANNYDLYSRDGQVLDAGSGAAVAVITGTPIGYFISQHVYAFALTGSFVWPFTREFNLSVGLGPSVSLVSHVQHYDQILVHTEATDGTDPGVTFARRLIVMNYLGVGAKATFDMEYFVLPRFSVNVGVAGNFIYQLPPLEVDAYSPTTGDYYYTRDHRAIDAFGLDPFRLPDGTEIDHTLFSASYLKIYLGFSFYL
jgi:hypothetical protein